MFNLKVVQNCPVTRASQGRITMPTWLLAECVGTLEREKGQEWLILLKGFRSKDGMEVQITGAEVPPDQQRTPTHVHIEPIAYRHSVVGEEHLTEGIVGALHSHNEMSAVFSGTDDKDINQKFEVSIVISSKITDDESTWLGFSYEAVGKVKLPCGSLGMIPFKVVPEGVEDWPLPGEAKIESDYGSLGDCSNVLSAHPKFEWGEDKYHLLVRGKCGETAQDKVLTMGVFGECEGEMASLLPPPHKPKVIYGGWRDRNGEDVAKAYVDAEFEPEPIASGSLECECCGEKKGHYLLIGKDIICKECEPFWREVWVRDGQEPSEAAWIADWDEDRAWKERWDEIAERGGL